MPGGPYGVVLGDAPSSGVQDSPLMGSMMESRSGSTMTSTIGSTSGKSDKETNMMNSWGDAPDAVHVMRRVHRESPALLRPTTATGSVATSLENMSMRFRGLTLVRTDRLAV